MSSANNTKLKIEPRKLSFTKKVLDTKPKIRDNFMKTQNMQKFLRLISPEAKKVS